MAGVADQVSGRALSGTANREEEDGGGENGFHFGLVR